LFKSVCPLTHAPPQAVSPAGQHVPFEMASPFGQTQAPDTQLAVAGHAFPQPLQLSGSVI
jgi:hypothetical protein